MIRLIRNTLANKEGFMIFVLWNQLWVTALISWGRGWQEWVVHAGAGMLFTLLVSPLYFIRKDTLWLRYLVTAGLVSYAVAFQQSGDFASVGFYELIVIGLAAVYLDARTVTGAGAVLATAAAAGHLIGWGAVRTDGELIVELLAIAVMTVNMAYLCLAGQTAMNRVQAAKQQAEEKEQQLRSIFEEIAQVSRTLQHMSAQVDERADSAKQNLDEMLNAFREVAVGMESQANSTIRVEEDIQSMDRDIAEISHQSNQMKQEANESEQHLSVGIAMMRELSERIDEIDQTVHTASQTIDQLNERAQQVENIVETIHQIASQTNLLALNAAIESARAGEHGRGFAVVADEVRKLAEESTRATQEIASILESLRMESAQAVDRIREGEASVEKGKAAAQQTTSSMEVVRTGMAGLVAAVDTVLGSIEQVKQRSGEIAQEMSNITAVTEESVASLEELSATADSQGRVIAGIAEEIHHLHGISQRLKASLGE